MRSNQFKYILFFVFAMTVMWSGVAQAEKTALENTDLFTALAKDCKDVDLPSWKHPTKSVLAAENIPLEKVQICNEGKYPVFYVRFKFDPNLQTNDNYFHPLYIKMAQANGYWSYSFVSLNDKTVVSAKPLNGTKTQVTLSYEPYE